MDSTIEKGILESLIKLSRSKETLYKKLCELEINELKGTELYKKVLDYLDIEEEVENNVYKKLSLSAKKCRDVINTIINKFFSNMDISDFESIVLNDHSNAYLRRTINNLDHQMKNDFNGFFELSLKDECDSKIQEEFINYYEKEIYEFNLLLNYLKTDFINAFLLFLNESIENEKNINIKNQLIKTKYFTAFIFGESDKEIVFSNKKDYKLLNNTLFIKELTCNNSDEYENVKRLFLCRNANQQIHRMLNEDNSKENLIVRKALLRTFLMLMDDEELFETNLYYNHLIENMVDKFDIRDIIVNCFIHSHEDRNKQITLRIR